jgi:DNA-binding SARP family transcriptional activator
VRFRIGGPLQIIDDDGRLVEVPGARRQALLGILLLRAPGPVSSDQLAYALWGDTPPATARRQIQNDVSSLRRLFTEAGAAGPVIVAGPGGYRVPAEAGTVDVRVFTGRVGEGLRLASSGRAAEAAVELRAALAMWAGRPLDGLALYGVTAEIDRLAEQRLAAIESCVDAELAGGRSAHVIGDLTELVAEYPLRERPVEQLMLALYRSGRRADALRAYRELRERLAEEGLDPGVPLNELHAAILGDRVAVVPEAVRAEPESRPAPAQLPADVPHFSGRRSALSWLDSLVPDVRAGRAATVAVVAGLAGVGKTALAVHWAHGVRDLFPHGQLYVDLRGYASAVALRPIEALTHLLTGLGLPAVRVPTETAAAAALYRSMLADRRVLVLLDNAATADQIRPLLPGGAGCLALITSRHQLPGLVARHGARAHPLDVLSRDEAAELLRMVLGDNRVAAEPAGAADLANACSYLPLALRVASAALTDDPAGSIAAYAATLRHGDRMAGLTLDGDEEAGVRHALDLSYNMLAPAVQQMFRLLGVTPAREVTADSAAPLAGVDRGCADDRLRRLAQAHLLTRPAPGRYGMHDLVRAYAAGKAQETDVPADRRAALDRLGDWYLRWAEAAADILYTQRLRPPMDRPTGPAPSPAPFDLGTPDGPLAWFDAEWANLAAVVRHTATDGPRRTAWLLADVLRAYFWSRVSRTDWAETARRALTAAEAECDPAAQAAVHINLGDLASRSDDSAAALTHYERANRFAAEAGWRAGEAAALGKMGLRYADTGRPREAADCYTRALSQCEDDDPFGPALLHGFLSSVCRELGRLDEATTHCEQALSRFRNAGARHGEMAALEELGQLMLELGRLPEAGKHLTQSLEMRRALGDRGNEASTLRILAAVHLEKAELDRALELATEATALAQDVADRRMHAEALNSLGSVRLRTGEPERAVEDHRRALDLAIGEGYRYTEVESLLGLADAHRMLGHLDQSRKHADVALRISQEVGFTRLGARALRLLGQAGTGPPAPDARRSK